jgi:hypothetical protein
VESGELENSYKRKKKLRKKKLYIKSTTTPSNLSPHVLRKDSTFSSPIPLHNPPKRTRERNILLRIQRKVPPIFFQKKKRRDTCARIPKLQTTHSPIQRNQPVHPHHHIHPTKQHPHPPLARKHQ